MAEDLDLQIAAIKREHDELGSLAKIKRTCKPELALYKSRLLRRRDAVTNSIDFIPDHGEGVLEKYAKLKAERKLLTILIQEIDEAEDLYVSTGEALTELIKKKKTEKVKPRKQTRSNSVPPE